MLVCEILSRYQKREQHMCKTWKEERGTQRYNDITQSGTDLSLKEFMEQNESKF